jgi:hypothetical protein
MKALQWYFVIYFHQHYLYHYIYHLFVFKVFVFRATSCFTNQDYRLIRVTSPRKFLQISEALLYMEYLTIFFGISDNTPSSDIV